MRRIIENEQPDKICSARRIANGDSYSHCNLLSILLSVHFISEPDSSTVDDIVVSSQESISSAEIEGQRLFNADCTACHAIHKRLTGPALSGFEERGPWKDRKQVYAWMRDPQAYIKRNAYTRNLYKEYQVMMTPYPGLTEKQIDSVIDFINRKQEQFNLPFAMQ